MFNVLIYLGLEGIQFKTENISMLLYIAPFLALKQGSKLSYKPFEDEKTLLEVQDLTPPQCGSRAII